MKLSITSSRVCATRRSKAIAAAALTAAAVTTTLVLGQSGVPGAENENSPDDSQFTVVGDGELPTKRPTFGDSRDPLSTDETGYAIHIATSDASVPAGTTDVDGDAGPEVLYTDIPDTDVDAGGRRALVVLYDYTQNLTYFQTVDLKAGSVIRTKSAPRLQPPMSSDEADTAIEIAINASTPPRFVKDFEAAEGVPLVSPKQIAYRVGAWTYDKTTTGGSTCGADRCAQLMVSTPSGTYLDTSDAVVNLSTGSVVPLDAGRGTNR